MDRAVPWATSSCCSTSSTSSARQALLPQTQVGVLGLSLQLWVDVSRGVICSRTATVAGAAVALASSCSTLEALAVAAALVCLQPFLLTIGHGLITTRLGLHGHHSLVFPIWPMCSIFANLGLAAAFARILPAVAESDKSESDEEDYDSDDDGGAALYRYEQRERRRLQRLQRRSGVAAREVTELGPPMAVLVPPGMSMNGGAAADKDLKEVRLLRGF